MTITFENDNDVIVYALEKVISYARRTQQIFVANCVWWLASIIGLESGLTNYIDRLKGREEVRSQYETSKEIPRERSVSAVPRDLTEQEAVITPKDCGRNIHPDRVQLVESGR